MLPSPSSSRKLPGLTDLSPRLPSRRTAAREVLLHETLDAATQAVQARGCETMKHHMISHCEVEPIGLAAHWVAPETADLHGGRARAVPNSRLRGASKPNYRDRGADER